MKTVKQAVPFLLLSTVMVLADQLLKIWVRGNLPLYGDRPLMPGFVGLTYVQNTGAAFSFLKDHTWLLAIVSVVVSALLVIMLLRGTLGHVVGNLALATTLGGTAGNMIDRVFFGFVTDMIHLEFVEFAIFNLADISLTIGAVFLFIYITFIWGKEERKEAEP